MRGFRAVREERERGPARAATDDDRDAEKRDSVFGLLTLAMCAVPPLLVVLLLVARLEGQLEGSLAFVLIPLFIVVVCTCCGACLIVIVVRPPAAADTHDEENPPEDEAGGGTG
eukprot:CAMPEP_0113662576 /NCGR_PEP_ID=MMETSP0038_2-20120614/655_1 /TAXON_ID=2898 /ORGANISM="Cryptomonas paramecium" /LENGTH=113 /DNA_ID=CAMNT_0000577491 /DNA_START=790 /DNA_END=1127 /DNA_ORIENTATION=- /assembly_acc=CAM_ASM_000170